jgi:predicted enzyme related to lactoylglutathione lyase
MPKHPIVHIELSAKDREASGKFYHDLFGWEIQQMPEWNYATFSTGEGSPGGGLNPITPENPAGTILVYINTDDIQASLRQVESLGGIVVSQPMPIPDVGLFALFKDSTGNTLALLEPHGEGM